MTLRVCFSKGERVCFLSHLDLMKALIRAMRRASIPFAFSKGYNPRPKIAMGPPLPVGITSEAEYMDVDLKEEVSIIDFSKALTRELPADLNLKQVTPIVEGPSLMALLDTACYHIPFPTQIEREDQEERFTKLYARGDLQVLRRKKKKSKTVDLRPLIKRFELTPLEKVLEVKMYVSIGNSGNVRPQELLEIMPKVIHGLKRPSLTEVKRVGLYYEKEGSFLTPV